MSDIDDNTCCWRCGYSLSGFDEDAACPECGLSVLIARREVPLIFRSRAQKWIGILSLMCVVPLLIVGFVIYLGAALSIIDLDTGLYGSVIALTLSSITGVVAAWCMKVPKRGFSASSCVSMAFFAAMFLWLWPMRILIAGSSLGSAWTFSKNMLFLGIVMSALGSLAIQAKSFALKTGMAGPQKRHISFDQISYLAFVSAGMMALGAVLKVVSPLIHLSDRVAGMSIGLGMLLGILPFVIWLICLYSIICRLARWPIGER